MSERRGLLLAVGLHLLAGPAYVVRFVFAVRRLIRLRVISLRGFVTCPHCGEENPIDVLSTCPRCKTSEYGNRLRCTGCGKCGTAFDCDACGVTIHCL